MEKKDIRKNLSVKVSEDYYIKVKEFAFAHRMSISDTLRAALNDYIEREEKNDSINRNNN